MCFVANATMRLCDCKERIAPLIAACQSKPMSAIRPTVLSYCSRTSHANRICAKSQKNICDDETGRIAAKSYHRKCVKEHRRNCEKSHMRPSFTVKLFLSTAKGRCLLLQFFLKAVRLSLSPADFSRFPKCSSVNWRDIWSNELSN